MAPSKANQGPPYSKDEVVLCFHGEMLYEAKVLDTRQTDNSAWEYKIHYKGWKATWDDWVPQDRVRKFTDENKELAASLYRQMRIVKDKSGASGKGKKGGRGAGSDFSSVRGSEERSTTAAAQAGRGPRRGRDYDLETEESFLNRPSIKLEVDDVLKALLVGDWENVTKNYMLVPLPSPHSVNSILNDYLAEETAKRAAGSSEESVLEEIVVGLKVYFEKCLSRILLYSFERIQYQEMKEMWNATTGDLAGKTAADTYGPEHLARLLVSLPELVAQTNMDQQSVNRLRDEMLKFSRWLAKNSLKYFTNVYEESSQSYIDRARG